MAHPLTNPQSDAEFSDLQSMLGAEIERSAKPAQPARPRPVEAVAGRGAANWGPSTQRVTSPLALLSEVAEETYRLQSQVEELVSAITGEKPPEPRQRRTPGRGALLPMITYLATEVQMMHNQISEALLHVRKQL